jgi:two-component system, NarL family, sensor kinase
VGESRTAEDAGTYGVTVHDVTSRSRVDLWVARLLAVLASGLAAVAVALPLMGGHTYLVDLMQTPDVVVAVSFSVTGALLVGSEQARRIGWLLLAIGLSSSWYVGAASYTAFVLGGDPDAALPAGHTGLVVATAWIANWSWFPAWVLVATVLPAVVPYGRPLTPRWRIPLVVAGAVLVLGLVDFAVAPGQLAVFSRIDNPLALPAVSDGLAPIVARLDLLVVGLLVLAVASVVVRYRRADGIERRQVGWFGYSVLMAVLLLVAVPQVAEVPAGWVNLSVLLIPAGLAVAALRYRLYDLDLVVNRTLVIALLLAGGAIAYVAVVAWVGALFGTSDGIVPFVAAFAVALAFHPARIRVQRAVDRVFHGRRGDPYALLRDLDRALRDAESPREALAHATRVIRHGLRLPGARVVVPTPDGAELRESSGSLDGTVEVIALELHGEQVGVLEVLPRGGRGRLGDADHRVLIALAGPVASAAYAFRLSGDLAESHRRLLRAREEERRRLRRDLHDGLGPQLAGVVMGLDVVRSKLARGETARAAQLSGTITDQARTAVEDVRRLASGLRPPALDDLGLVGALRSTGPASVGHGPVVSVVADGELEHLPAAVEVAAYRIAQEAMTNAVRHGAATRIDVRLSAVPEGMDVQITDDGIGIASEVVPGVGLLSMRERAAELGGWCTISPAQPGTRVHAHLPLVAT